MSIRQARQRTDLYTLEELKAELSKHFDHLNLQPRKNAPSRYDLWRSVISHPAPPIHIMATLDIMETAEALVNVDDWSIQLLGESWEPKATGKNDEQIYRAWMDAVASPQPVTARGVRLDVGWRAEVCIQGTWIAIVTKDMQVADMQHLKGQNGSLALLRDERRKLVNTATAEVLQLTDGVVPHLVSSDGTYNIPALTQPNIAPEVEQLSAAGDRGASSETNIATKAQISDTAPKISSSNRGRRRQSSKAAVEKSSTVATPATVTAAEEMPDMATILAKIAAQLDN